MKRFIIFMLMTKCFFSCNIISFGNQSEVKRMLESFSREYTGLDTLIRTDGYYYHEGRMGLLHEPFIMSNNGEFHILYVQYKNHNRIQERFRDNTPVSRGRGGYTLSGDTITVRWAMPYQIGCYHIFSGQYVIENDTTLRLIFFLCETCNGEKSNSIRNEIYKFYKYPVEIK